MHLVKTSGLQGFVQMKLTRNPRATTCFVEFMDVPTAMAVHDSQQVRRMLCCFLLHLPHLLSSAHLARHRAQPLSTSHHPIAVHTASAAPASLLHCHCITQLCHADAAVPPATCRAPCWPPLTVVAFVSSILRTPLARRGTPCRAWAAP